MSMRVNKKNGFFNKGLSKNPNSYCGTARIRVKFAV